MNKATFLDIKKHWTYIMQTAVLISAFILNVLMIPVFKNYDGSGKISNIPSFIAGIIICLLIIPVLKFKRKKYYRIWFGVAIVSCLAGLIALAFYFVDYHKHTAKYNEQLILVGTPSDMTPEGKRQMKMLEEKFFHRPIEVNELIWSNAGKVTEIWDKDSLDEIYYLLLIQFMLVIILFSVFSITIFQAIKCFQYTK